MSHLLHQLKKNSTTVFLLFVIGAALAPLLFVHAQEPIPTNIGFVESSIWYGNEPFFAGEVVRIYTILANSSDADFAGTVTFFDNDEPIGSSEFSLTRAGGVHVVWVDWTPEDGEHTIVAKILEAETSRTGEEPQRITRKDWQSSVSTRYVDLDTDGDGIGNREDTDDDNDGIADEQDDDPLVANQSVREEIGSEIKEEVKTIFATVLPIVSAALSPVTKVLEEFRESQSDRVHSLAESVKSELDSLDSDDLDDTATVTVPGQINTSQGSGKKVVGGNKMVKRAEYFALAAAGFALDRQFIFYPILLFIGGYLVLYKFGVWIFRRLGSVDRL